MVNQKALLSVIFAELFNSGNQLLIHQMLRFAREMEV